MAFHSILFAHKEDHETAAEPDFFRDLNLDQIIEALVMGKQVYHLRPLFYTPLHDQDSILYRHEVMQDLENPILLESLEAFAREMLTMHRYMDQAETRSTKHQQTRWYLDAIQVYCMAVLGLERDLTPLALKSRGLLAFRQYLSQYTQAEYFTALLAEANQLKADLAAVRYCLLIQNNSITVRQYDGETDYSQEVEKTFAKFQQGAAKNYLVDLRAYPEMNHVEVQILEFVTRLYPDLFARLDLFCQDHTAYLDEIIGVFEREIQFYMAYREFITRFQRAGLPFCYPQICTDKAVYSREGFDLALANKLLMQPTPIICNDFYLEGSERILVVSGPNQGGKTTFARMFGQLHYLASLGCPVPGSEARLYLCDRLFTHFENQEDMTNMRGKLKDDLVRIQAILQAATPNSLIIMNEIFTSTTLQDAIFLSEKIMAAIIELDLLCVCVTFIDELADLSEKTVSMVSTVVADNPGVRTFKIIRKPPDGLAYAISIAEKYRVTYAQLMERLP